MACFFEVFRTLLKCSPIWAQKANACTILELSRLFWYPYHLWKWLSSGDIAVFKIFLQIFLLQRHLVTVFHKWKINFKVFLIDLVPFRYFFHAFWWPNQKKCLVDFSRDTSLWKESTENLSVCIRDKQKTHLECNISRNILSCLSSYTRNNLRNWSHQYHVPLYHSLSWNIFP